MSRLAGAGGAAESALMNSHAHANQAEAGDVEGDESRVHLTKFTGNLGRVQAVWLLAVRTILLGLDTINGLCRLNEKTDSMPQANAISQKS